MNHKSHEATTVGHLGAPIGKGLIAGLAGTIAMTISQKIETKFTGRKPSRATVKAVKKVLHIHPDKGNAEQFSNEIHYTYGSVNGILRGLLSIVGITGFAATSVHLAAIWGTAMTVEPSLHIAPPLAKWKTKDIAIDIFHHAVYAIVTGMVFDAID